MDDTIKKLWNYVKDSYYNYKSNPTAFKLFKIVLYILVFVVGAFFILFGHFILKLAYALTKNTKTQSREYRECPQVIVVDRGRSYQRSQTEQLFGDNSEIPHIRKPQVGVPREFQPPKPYFPRTPDPFEGQPRRSKRRKGGEW